MYRRPRHLQSQAAKEHSRSDGHFEVSLHKSDFMKLGDVEENLSGEDSDAYFSGKVCHIVIIYCLAVHIKVLISIIQSLLLYFF